MFICSATYATCMAPMLGSTVGGNTDLSAARKLRHADSARRSVKNNNNEISKRTCPVAPRYRGVQIGIPDHSAVIPVASIIRPHLSIEVRSTTEASASAIALGS